MINYILSKSNIMINYVGFTIVWFSCVYSGAKGDPIIALIPTFIFLFLHFLIVTDHLKEEIQRLLEQGLDDDDIKRALTERYSDFILYDPKFNKNTYFLWLAPFIVLLIGFWWVYSMSTKNYISQSKDRDLEK